MGTTRRNRKQEMTPCTQIMGNHLRTTVTRTQIMESNNKKFVESLIKSNSIFLPVIDATQLNSSK